MTGCTPIVGVGVMVGVGVDVGVIVERTPLGLDTSIGYNRATWKG